jgi:predicted ribosomally synthesized peptide with SipW-like signal peptide
MKKKMIALTAALVLVLSAAVVGTVAWLTDKTQAKVNTFTVGNIAIDLTETTKDYKMVPGEEIAKDPKVSVEVGSEACWLFVKVEEANDLDKFIDYDIASGWQELTDVAGVYYREVAADATEREFSVLANDKVTVKDTVTKADMDAIKADSTKQPTLTFTAYAVQQAGFTTPELAWAEANK